MLWSNFFSFPENATIWDLLNSNAVAALLGAYLTYSLTVLSSRTREAQRKAEDAQERAEDAETLAKAGETVAEQEESLETGEEPRQIAEAAPGPNFRDQASEIARAAKEHLIQLAERDTDQRHQRTYRRISGHRPSVLAAALAERDQITQDQLSAAVEIFKLWNLYQRGRVAERPVPQEVFNAMQRASRVLIT